MIAPRGGKIGGGVEMNSDKNPKMNPRMNPEKNLKMNPRMNPERNLEMNPKMNPSRSFFTERCVLFKSVVIWHLTCPEDSGIWISKQLGFQSSTDFKAMHAH
jgi:hypothetical protein